MNMKKILKHNHTAKAEIHYLKCGLISRAIVFLSNNWISRTIACCSVFFFLKKILVSGVNSDCITELIACCSTLGWAVLCEFVDFGKLYMRGPGGRDILSSEDSTPRTTTQRPAVSGPGGRDILNPDTSAQETAVSNVQSSSTTLQAATLQASTSSQPVIPDADQSAGADTLTFSNIPRNYYYSALYNDHRDNPKSEESINAHIRYLQERKICVTNRVSVIKDDNYQKMRGAYYFRPAVLDHNEGDEDTLRAMQYESVVIDGFRVPKYTLNPRNQIFPWNSRHAVLPCGVVLSDTELTRLGQQPLDFSHAFNPNQN